MQSTFLGKGATCNVRDIKDGKMLEGMTPISFFLFVDTETEDQGILYEDKYGRLRVPCFCRCTNWPEEVSEARSKLNYKDLTYDPESTNSVVRLVLECKVRFKELYEWEYAVKFHEAELHNYKVQVKKLQELEAEVLRLQREVSQRQKSLLISEVLVRLPEPPLPLPLVTASTPSQE
jgi:hypothetical protein